MSLGPLGDESYPRLGSRCPTCPAITGPGLGGPGGLWGRWAGPPVSQQTPGRAGAHKCERLPPSHGCAQPVLPSLGAHPQHHGGVSSPGCAPPGPRPCPLAGECFLAPFFPLANASWGTPTAGAGCWGGVQSQDTSRGAACWWGWGLPRDGSRLLNPQLCPCPCGVFLQLPGVPAELLSCKLGESGAGHPAGALGARVLPVPAAGSCLRGMAPAGPQRAGGDLVGSDRAPVPKSGPAEGGPRCPAPSRRSR